MAERLKTQGPPDVEVKKARKIRQPEPEDFMDGSPVEIVERHPDSFVAVAIRRGYKRNRRIIK
jgi:hypothetical protein